jgi:hypothetical protein
MKYHIYPNGRGTFNITEKRDHTKPVPWSGSACRSIINPMPGATSGFKSIRNALLAIKVLERVNAQGRNPSDFWPVYHRAAGVTERSRVDRVKMAAAMKMRVVRLSRNSFRYEPLTSGSAS